MLPAGSDRRTAGSWSVRRRRAVWIFTDTDSPQTTTTKILARTDIRLANFTSATFDGDRRSGITAARLYRAP